MTDDGAPRDSQRAELVAIRTAGSVSGTGKPRVALDLELNGSVHVLYGLNGAGKTLSIETIRDALLPEGAAAQGGMAHGWSGGWSSGSFASLRLKLVNDSQPQVVDADSNEPEEVPGFEAHVRYALVRDLRRLTPRSPHGTRSDTFARLFPPAWTRSEQPPRTPRLTWEEQETLPFSALYKHWLRSRLTTAPIWELEQVLRRGDTPSPELVYDAELSRLHCDAIARELARQGHFYLTWRRGEWVLSVGFTAGPSYPSITKELEVFCYSWDLNELDREAWDRGWFRPPPWLDMDQQTLESFNALIPQEHHSHHWEELQEVGFFDTVSEAHDRRVAYHLALINEDPELQLDYELLLRKGEDAVPLDLDYLAFDQTLPTLKVVGLPITVVGAADVDVDRLTRGALRERLSDARNAFDEVEDVDLDGLADEDEMLSDSDHSDFDAASEDPALLANAAEAEHEALVLAALDLGTSATAFLAQLLPNAPQLSVAMPDPDDMLADVPYSFWRARYEHGSDLALSSLSQATQRLAKLAVEMAVATSSPGAEYIVVLLDEPELGLHRQAERRLFDTLEEWARRPKTLVVACTHSPTAFRIPDATFHHVARRTDGQIMVSRMNPPTGALLREELDLLGLTPSDLLVTKRVFLLVEGRHDELVLSKLFGAGPDGFDTRGIQILAMHGGRHTTSVIDSAFLWDHTDAMIAVLLDRVPLEALQVLWNEAHVRLHDAESDNDRDAVANWFRTEASQVLRNQVAGAGKAQEIDWITTLGSRAIQQQRMTRLELLGHEADDILDYLPTEPIRGATWQAEKQKGRVTDEIVTAAVDELNSVPEELQAVRDACLRLARWS